MKQNNTKNIWTIGNYDTDKVETLVNELSLKEFLSKVLVAKGFDTPEKASEYLNGTINSLADPFLLKDMDKAVNKIKSAVGNHDKIMIYGDYDVDGITSVAALWRYLTFKGADVCCYIPERINEGYGLNSQAIAKFAEEGVKLIITVDSGITAHEEIEFAKSLGIDVVITDHHECREELPEAVAVVNPHREDSEYPFKELAGVGVVFRLICAYEGNRNLSNICAKYSDIVALGTVADVMPIVGENRIIVKHGLASLVNTKNKGLCSLIEQTFAERKSSQRKNITAASIGFGLAPRINAAGRIGNVNQALKLLITENKAEADNIATYLCAVNRERQLIENMIFEEAVNQIESNHDFDNDKVIVLVSEKWHLGVIGIVASKITERYKLPSILISIDGDVGKGSGRSIKGFNINEAISECKSLLIKYGGHELAAGLTIDKSNIDAFRRAINEYAKGSFDFSSVCNYIDADFEIDVKDVTVGHAKELQSMEPFGLQNPLPLFFIKDAKISELYPIGDGKHIKMIIEKNGFLATALYFGMSSDRFAFSEGDTVDFMCNMDINDFRGTLSVQLIVKDVRMSERDNLEKLHNEKAFEELMSGNYSVRAKDVPSMTEFRAAFLYLKSVIRDFDVEKNLSIWKCSRDLSKQYSAECSHLMFNIILTVFEEMKLISLSRENSDSVYVSLCKTEGKINIESSDFLSKISKI
ncbi:MAG: single-stranded-DNA-specific exonuclease RecJ [Clostridia bacterium]|nr:single-stranded-DNA-specific exonuclease RecJ [Clostridia bacterium]